MGLTLTMTCIMKCTLALTILLTTAAAIAQTPQVYSRSLPQSGNSMLVALKVRFALRDRKSVV